MNKELKELEKELTTLIERFEELEEKGVYIFEGGTPLERSEMKEIVSKADEIEQAIFILRFCKSYKVRKKL